MKVEIIAGKYKAADGEGWYKRGDKVELPEDEGNAAISAGVAKRIGEPTAPQPPAAAPVETPEQEPRRGRPPRE